MKKAKLPPSGLLEWVEFCWLLLTNSTFQAASDKRRAFFEHQLGKIYTARCPEA